MIAQRPMSAARAGFVDALDQLAMQKYRHTGPGAYYMLARYYANQVGIPYTRENAVAILHTVYQDFYLPSLDDFQRAEAEEEEEQGEREYRAQLAAQAQPQAPPGRPAVKPEGPVIYFGEQPPPPPEEDNGPSLEELDARRKAAGERLQAVFDAQGPDAAEDAYRNMGSPFGGG